MRTHVLLALAACAHETARPVGRPPTPPPAPAPEPELQGDCSPNGVMGAPEESMPIRPLDPANPRETIELLTCKLAPPPYEPKVDEDGKPDENDAYWHSFSSWKVYLVRAGAHPFQWDTGLGVGQFHEGNADARVVGVLQTPVPLVVIELESGAMGVHTFAIVVFRVGSPPEQIASYSGSGVAVEMTPKGFVLESCYATYEQSEQGIDCMTLPDQIEMKTFAWTGTELATISTSPYKQPPPR
jgi:hypothetical protein